MLTGAIRTHGQALVAGRVDEYDYIRLAQNCVIIEHILAIPIQVMIDIWVHANPI